MRRPSLSPTSASFAPSEADSVRTSSRKAWSGTLMKWVQVLGLGFTCLAAFSARVRSSSTAAATDASLGPVTTMVRSWGVA